MFSLYKRGWIKKITVNVHKCTCIYIYIFFTENWFLFPGYTIQTIYLLNGVVKTDYYNTNHTYWRNQILHPCKYQVSIRHQISISVINHNKLECFHTAQMLLITIKFERCTTTKHGYQSKRTYGKVVRKHKMDSYIVG